MPSKKAILAELTAGELRRSLDGCQLSVADRRVKAQLVATLARSRRAPIERVLQYLPRKRLKQLCRALDLDDSGRSKADLIACLTRKTGPAGRRREAVGKALPASPMERRDIPSPKTLSVAELEKHLWSAADILRGSIDSSDYKTYIFGLLFLKRLSDRFEEEAERLIALGDTPDAVAWTDPDYHEFFVPDRARWSAIEKTATNIGECLNKACMALEEQNAGLEGVLAGIDWNDEHRLGDGRQRDSVLARLVQHFSHISLGNDCNGRAGHARARLRIPDRAVRGRRRQEGRRVLYPAHGGAADRRAARPAGADAHLRPDGRLRRHADRVRPLRRARQRLSAPT